MVKGVRVGEHVSRLGGWTAISFALMGVATGVYIYQTYLRPTQEVIKKQANVPKVIQDAQQEYAPEVDRVFSI